MYFSVILLFLTLTYGAPTDPMAEPRDGPSIDGYEEKVTPIVEPMPTYAAPQYPTNENHDTYEEKTTHTYETPEVAYDSTHPLSPPVIEVIEERPNGVLEKQTTIITNGKHLSEAITAKIVGPIVIFNSKVAAAAGALPPLLAAKGAIIGSAIATPIEIGAVAGSSIASGVTGKLVAIPISVVSGAAAKFVGAAQKGQQIWKFNLEHGHEIMKDGLIKMGHIILKPIAVVVGAQTALTGAGLGITGSGIKGVGVGLEAVGAKMIATGLTAKAVGKRVMIL